jgi:hypothetical protein
MSLELTLEKLLRLVIQQRLGPVYLFVGPSSSRREASALTVTQSLVCEARGPDGSPCANCGSCVRIANGQSEALLEVRPEGLMIKLEQASEINSFCALKNPGPARAIIVHSVDRMNAQAANSLLKLFEESPPRTHFFMLAPSAQSVLPTVRSRAQVVRFPAGPRPALSDSEAETKELAARVWAARWRGKGSESSDLLELLREAAPSRESALLWVRFWREFHVNEILDPPQDFVSSRWSARAQGLNELEQALIGNSDVQLAVEVFLRREAP